MHKLAVDLHIQRVPESPAPAPCAHVALAA